MLFLLLIVPAKGSPVVSCAATPSLTFVLALVLIVPAKGSPVVSCAAVMIMEAIL